MKKALRYIFILILDTFVNLLYRDYIIFHIVCELLKEGVAAIFGPASRHTRGIVASIAARFDIPHIEYVWRESEVLEEENEEITNDHKCVPMTINVFPESEKLSKVSRYTREIFCSRKSIL